jgi:hypothetical protein
LLDKKEKSQERKGRRKQSRPLLVREAGITG